MLRLLAFFLTITALAACQPRSWSANQAGGNAAANPAPATAETDEARDRQAEKRAYNAPIGQQLTWNNPATGDSGTVTPVRDSYDGSGAYCRELKSTSVIAGRQQQSDNTACQQADGSWKSKP